jgi:UDP-glucose 4-epimerase
MTSSAEAAALAKPGILVTGGAGYIGSITTVALIERGWRPVVLDNFVNSQPAVVKRIEQLTGTPVALVRADVRDASALDTVFAQHRIDAVVHFAGLKAVGESVARPLDYHDVNVGGTVTLLRAMARVGVARLVFSSSATIYGEPARMPITEDSEGAPINPYGRSKWLVEQILTDQVRAQPGWAVAALRYFNPVGAHPSGELGEDPRGTPANLMPFLAQVAVGRQPALRVFGSDYPTPDGTGVRDYLHVMDLADGHLAALELLFRAPGMHTVNLGTGRGHSVLELHAAFQAACGLALPLEHAPRRAGDIAACWADASRAQLLLGWRARRSLAEMCEDTWRWQSRHPEGYPST